MLCPRCDGQVYSRDEVHRIIEDFRAELAAQGPTGVAVSGACVELRRRLEVMK